MTEPLEPARESVSMLPRSAESCRAGGVVGGRIPDRLPEADPVRRSAGAAVGVRRAGPASHFIVFGFHCASGPDEAAPDDDVPPPACLRRDV